MDQSQQSAGGVGVGAVSFAPAERFATADSLASTSFVFSNNAVPMFTIKPDGTIERGPAFTTVDEASLEFWRAVERMAPQFFQRGAAS